MSKMVPRFASITNTAIESQIIKQAVPDIYQEDDENRFGSFKGKAWSVWLEFLSENG